MRKSILSCFVLVFGLIASVSGQTFTFECICSQVTGDTCDICPTNNGLDSRSFNGLLIKKNGLPFKLIDEPYMVKAYANESITFLELIPSPQSINIALWQTQFATINDFIDSTTCSCSNSLGEVVVDTPIIGNGTNTNPLTIGQFGADTTMFLNWNGSYWYPANIQFSDLLLDLPYFTGDTAALSGGLNPGDAYLLACDNDYSLPAGIFKVIKICSFDCSFLVRFYVNDLVAFASGVPVGREYALSKPNHYGLLYGFIKSVATDTLSNDTLICSVVLPTYDNDSDAITGGLAIGDYYTMTSTNDYGAPKGIVRVVSTESTVQADADPCCSLDATLPYFANDAAAIAGGYSSGNYYFLSSTNTLGFPYGTKKLIL